MAEIPPLSTSPALAPISDRKDHGSGVIRIACSTDGRWVASADHERRIVLSRDGQRLRSFEPFGFWERYPASRQIYDLAISIDSNRLFVAASDRLVAYDLESGRKLWRFRGPRQLTFLPSNPVGLAVNPVTGNLAAGFDSGHLGLWNPDGQCLGFWFDDQGPRRLGFTFDGRHLVGTDQYAICIWDVSTQTKIARHWDRHQIHGLALSKVDDVAATTDLYEVTIWRQESGAEMARIPVDPGLPLLAFSPAAPILAFASGSLVRLCDFNGRDLGQNSLAPGRPLSLALSADGTALLVGRADGSIESYRVPRP